MWNAGVKERADGLWWLVFGHLAVASLRIYRGSLQNIDLVRISGIE